jgi:Predicted molecular chaperone distantly related to HSP70-fold metalloproteases
VSIQYHDTYIAFDICAANRVLNMLAEKRGKKYDEEGMLAANGQYNQSLWEALNQFTYYQLSPPKSLANEFGTEVVFPLIDSFNLPEEDVLHTYCHHIGYQISQAIAPYVSDPNVHTEMLISGGGALNTFLIQCLQQYLNPYHIKCIVPDRLTVEFKEAVAMALIGVLRWREEENVLHSVTGARRDSIGGALWMGRQ